MYYYIGNNWCNVAGSFLCSVLDNISYLKEGCGDFSTLSDESILKRFGYGTGRANDLSDLQRQSILATLLDHRLIDKAAIVKKLTFFINMHKNRTEDYEQALIEWERDKSFVNKYTSTGTPKKKLSRR